MNPKLRALYQVFLRRTRKEKPEGVYDMHGTDYEYMLNFGRKTSKEHSGDLYVDGKINPKCSCLKEMWCENANCTECDLVLTEVLEPAGLIKSKHLLTGSKTWNLNSNWR